MCEFAQYDTIYFGCFDDCLCSNLEYLDMIPRVNGGTMWRYPFLIRSVRMSGLNITMPASVKTLAYWFCVALSVYRTRDFDRKMILIPVFVVLARHLERASHFYVLHVLTNVCQPPTRYRIDPQSQYIYLYYDEIVTLSPNNQRLWLNIVMHNDNKYRYPNAESVRI